jgi:hypothetical protein
MAKEDANLGDGTQASIPAATFGDALSGAGGKGTSDEFQMIRVAAPVQPDAAAVRELVDAEIRGEKRGSDGEPFLDDTPPASPAEPIAPTPPLGMLPRQRARKPFRVGRPSLRMPRLGLSQIGQVRRVRPSSGSTGVIVAVVLIIVFGVVAIQFISSLVGSITGAFN